MLTSKQRAYLRSLAAGEDTILHIGKGDIGENIIRQAADALKSRELIKAKVLESSTLSPLEAAEELSRETKSEVVQVIGGKFALYKKNEKEPHIELPKAQRTGGEKN